jgi:hypothetical protein
MGGDGRQPMSIGGLCRLNSSLERGDGDEHHQADRCRLLGTGRSHPDFRLLNDNILDAHRQTHAAHLRIENHPAGNRASDLATEKRDNLFIAFTPATHAKSSVA